MTPRMRANVEATQDALRVLGALTRASGASTAEVRDELDWSDSRTRRALNAAEGEGLVASTSVRVARHPRYNLRGHNTVYGHELRWYLGGEA